MFTVHLGGGYEGISRIPWGGVTSKMTLSAEKFPSDTVKIPMNTGLFFFMVMMINYSLSPLMF